MVKEIVRVGQEKLKVSHRELSLIIWGHSADLEQMSNGASVAVATPQPSTLKALDFGTPAKLNWDVLVAERERHETEEAKSAVTYRYKQAEVEDLVNAVTTNLGDDKSEVEVAGKDVEAEAAKSRSMKASVVTEITRVISAALTSTAKPNTTGLERRVRWRGLGVLAEDDEPDDSMVPAMRENDSADSARNIYNSLGKRLPLPFINAGIHFHPLTLGSWVLVGFKDRVWLGNGEYKYDLTEFLS